MPTQPSVPSSKHGGAGSQVGRGAQLRQLDPSALAVA